MKNSQYLLCSICSFSVFAILYTIHNIGVGKSQSYANTDLIVIFGIILIALSIFSIFKYFTSE